MTEKQFSRGRGQSMTHGHWVYMPTQAYESPVGPVLPRWSVGFTINAFLDRGCQFPFHFLALSLITLRSIRFLSLILLKIDESALGKYRATTIGRCLQRAVRTAEWYINIQSTRFSAA